MSKPIPNIQGSSPHARTLDASEPSELLVSPRALGGSDEVLGQFEAADSAGNRDGVVTSTEYQRWRALTMRQTAAPSEPWVSRALRVVEGGGFRVGVSPRANASVPEHLRPDLDVLAHEEAATWLLAQTPIGVNGATVTAAFFHTPEMVPMVGVRTDNVVSTLEEGETFENVTRPQVLAGIQALLEEAGFPEVEVMVYPAETPIGF